MGLETRGAAFVTELVTDTCRLQGTYDAIIKFASERGPETTQPAMVGLLRPPAYQAFGMIVPTQTAVATAVGLACDTVRQRVTGLIDAVGHRIAVHDLQEWVGLLSEGLGETSRLAIRTHHPRWIAAAYEKILQENEIVQTLEVNNLTPRPTLVMRSGFAEVEELAPVIFTMYSPSGAVLDGAPGDLTVTREGRAGVQDEGS